MIVAELIAALQKMPQDAKVIITGYDVEGKWDNEVRDVMYNDPSLENTNVAGTVELDNWPATDYF